MPDGFNININADPSGAIAGAQQAADALRKVSEQAKQIGAYEKQVNDELAASVRTVTKEEAALALKTAEATKAKTQLGQAAKQLGAEFPVLGSLGRMALNPIVGIATAGVVAIRWFKDGITALNAALTTSEFTRHTKVLEAHRQGLDNAKVAAGEFAEKMRQVRDATATASDASERLNSVMKARDSAEDKLDDARKRLELTQAGGIKDPAQRAKAEYEIEERYALRKKNREDEAARREIHEQYRKKTNEEINASLLEKRLVTLRKNAAELGTEAELDQRIAAERENLNKTEAEISSKRARVAELEDKPEWTWINPAQRQEYQVLTGQLHQLEAMRQQQAHLVIGLESAAPEKRIAIRGMASQLSMTEQMALGARQRAQGIAAMLPTQVATSFEEFRAREGTFGMDRLTRAQAALNTSVSSQDHIADQIAKAAEAGRAVDVAILRNFQSQEAWKRQIEAQVNSLTGTRKSNPPGL